MEFGKGAPGAKKSERPLTPGLFESNIKAHIEKSINIPDGLFQPIPHLDPENKEHHAKYQEIRNMDSSHPEYAAKMKEHVAEIQAHFKERNFENNPHLRDEAMKG